MEKWAVPHVCSHPTLTYGKVGCASCAPTLLMKIQSWQTWPCWEHLDVNAHSLED